MTNQEIKELLLLMFAQDFNIEKKANLYHPEAEPFEHSVYFEFLNPDGTHNDAQMLIDGMIYKNTESCYHQAFAELGGPGEQQGETSIKSWEIEEIQTFVNGEKAPFTITFKELQTT